MTVLVFIPFVQAYMSRYSCNTTAEVKSLQGITSDDDFICAPYVNYTGNSQASMNYESFLIIFEVYSAPRNKVACPCCTLRMCIDFWISVACDLDDDPALGFNPVGSVVSA